MSVMVPSQGEACTSVQWGAWAGSGMAASEPALLERLKRQGYLALTPSVGLAALQSILGAAGSFAGASIVASLFDWPALLKGDAQRWQGIYK